MPQPPGPEQEGEIIGKRLNCALCADVALPLPDQRFDRPNERCVHSAPLWDARCHADCRLRVAPRPTVMDDRAANALTRRANLRGARNAFRVAEVCAHVNVEKESKWPTPKPLPCPQSCWPPAHTHMDKSVASRCALARSIAGHCVAVHVARRHCGGELGAEFCRVNGRVSPAGRPAPLGKPLSAPPPLRRTHRLAQH